MLQLFSEQNIVISVLCWTGQDVKTADIKEKEKEIFIQILESYSHSILASNYFE